VRGYDMNSYGTDIWKNSAMILMYDERRATLSNFSVLSVVLPNQVTVQA
jgi:hypothetical protein